jgi:hypothetical protein
MGWLRKQVIKAQESIEQYPDWMKRQSYWEGEHPTNNTTEVDYDPHYTVFGNADEMTKQLNEMENLWDGIKHFFGGVPDGELNIMVAKQAQGRTLRSTKPPVVTTSWTDTMSFKDHWKQK